MFHPTANIFTCHNTEVLGALPRLIIKCRIEKRCRKWKRPWAK